MNIQTGVLVLFSLPISEPFCEPDLQRKAKSRVVFGVLRAVPDNSLTFCADPRKLSLVAPRQLLLLKLIQLRWSRRINGNDDDVFVIWYWWRWDCPNCSFLYKMATLLWRASRPCCWCTFTCHKVQGSPSTHHLPITHTWCCTNAMHHLPQTLISSFPPQPLLCVETSSHAITNSLGCQLFKLSANGTSSGQHHLQHKSKILIPKHMIRTDLIYKQIIAT